MKSHTDELCCGSREQASNEILSFKVQVVLELAPHPSLFGHPTGRKGLPQWMVFIRPQEFT